MNKINLKYPVILVHGLGAKDKALFWGRIPERMEACGLKIFLGNTDSWGSIENNASYLSQTVDKALKDCRCERVNIVAHSKGGLDSRYLISSLGYADKVASLTTVSTPHRGAELVDYIQKKKFFFNPMARKILSFLGDLYGDRSPAPYVILNELGTRSMIRFNRDNPNKEEVYYSSYHSVMNHAWDDPAAFFSYSYLKKVAGDNDGVVSLQSARWGEDFCLIEGRGSAGISHAQVIDVHKKEISGVDIPEVYLGMIRKLEERGC